MKRDIFDGVFGRGDAFDFVQHAAAEIIQRGGQQLRFMFDRDFVGALRRRQHRDDDADDGHGDDNADRDHHAQTGAIPTGVLPVFRSARSCHRRQMTSPKVPYGWTFPNGT
ncbi:MAG: hypothetical protein WDN48_11880 [Pseudolabrys sp.]